MFGKFQRGDKVRMVWKGIFCGGSNKGVVVNTCPQNTQVIVQMRDGDHVIHDLNNSQFCEVVREGDWKSFRRSFGFGRIF